MTVLIRGGTVVNADRSFRADVLCEDGLITAITKFPILLERPIVVNGNRAAIGRPPENVLDIL